MDEDAGFDAYLEEMYEDRFYADLDNDSPEPPYWGDEDDEDEDAFIPSDEYGPPPF